MYLAQNRTIAYLYRWTQKSTGMWYEGSRTRKGCHPNDGYICSAPVVETMITENQEDWAREILVMGESKYIRKLEELRLTSLDAKNDPMSYNKDNANGKFTTTGIPAWNKGLTLEGEKYKKGGQKNKGRSNPNPNKGKTLGPRKNKPVNPVWNKGLTKEDPRVAKYVDIQNRLVAKGKHNFSKLKGVPKSEEHKQKQRKPKHAGHGAKVSAARKGKIFLPRVTRLHDRKEMDIGNFNKWVKRQTLVMRDDSAFRDPRVQYNPH